MISKIGRKLVQGAKAEIQENPPEIPGTEKIIDLVETGIVLLSLTLMILGGLRSSKAPTTIVNNIYINGIKQI